MSGTLLMIGVSAASDAPHLAMPALWMAHRGHRVELICASDHSGSEAFATPIATVPARSVDSRGLLGMARLAIAIARARWNAPRSSVMVVLGSPATPAALLALLGVPPERVAYITQDLLGSRAGWWWRSLERRFARRSRVVISNEPHRARLLEWAYRLERRVAVVPTALPRDWPVATRTAQSRALALSAFQNAPADAVVIAAGGPFSPSRCSGEAIRALALLPPRFHLLFSASPAGSAARTAAEAAATAAGVLGRVGFLPRLPHDQTLVVYAGCDAGLLLYADDGFGNYCQCPGRLTEYLRAGIAVIASRFPSLQSVIEAKGLGSTCDQADPASIAAASAAVGELAETGGPARRSWLAQLAAAELCYDLAAPTLEALLYPGDRS